MARAKKADRVKSAGKTVKNEPEAVEQDVSQEPETAEEEQDISQELETAEGERDISQEPETEEESQDDTEETERTNAEASTEEETDMFANLPNPCVYCGPSVRGVARQYTTYQGGISDALREFIKKHPAALGLIVPAGKFPAMRKRLETRGTPEAKRYKAVKAEL